MSHHLDTPLAGQSGQLFIDDLYVFPGKDSTVFILDVNSNVTGFRAEPSFHPEGRYEFKIHFDCAELEELAYRVSFTPPMADGSQMVKLQELTGAAARDDVALGELVLQSRTGDTATNHNVRLWAGRIGDPFYIDLSLLGMVNSAIRNRTAVDLSKWQPEKAQNSFANTTVDAIVLEISHEHPRLKPGTNIGVWGATKLATDAGVWRQINRAGHPMMWPIFWPDDIKFTNPANTRHPSEDFKADGTYIAGLIADTVKASGTSDDPGTYGQAVAHKLFPDVLSYKIGTPALYGFAAQNGRTHADNAPEAMLSLVTNTAVPSGLKPATIKNQHKDSFPYVVPIE